MRAATIEGIPSQGAATIQGRLQIPTLRYVNVNVLDNNFEFIYKIYVFIGQLARGALLFGAGLLKGNLII